MLFTKLLSSFLWLPITLSQLTIFYGEGCPHCSKTISLLEEKKIPFESYEVYFDKTGKQLFFGTLNKFNYPISKAGVPTILVEQKDKKFLVIGEVDKETYKYLLDCPKCENNKVYSSSELKSLDQQTEKKDTQQNKNEGILLSTLILAALVDSINPCVLAIMAMLLINLMRQKSRKKTILAGFLFTFIVVSIYFLMGLGVIKALSFVWVEKIIYYVLLVLAIIMALLQFKAYFNYKPGFLSMEMPMFLRPWAKKVIESTTSLWFVAISAVILSFFLVPCSSGPYLLVLWMIASENLLEKLNGIIYLLGYNMIFALPMILITLLVAYKIKPEKVLEWRNENIKKLHLVSGILMLIIVLLLIYQIWAF